MSVKCVKQEEEELRRRWKKQAGSQINKRANENESKLVDHHSVYIPQPKCLVKIGNSLQKQWNHDVSVSLFHPKVFIFKATQPMYQHNQYKYQKFDSIWARNLLSKQVHTQHCCHRCLNWTSFSLQKAKQQQSNSNKKWVRLTPVDTCVFVSATIEFCGFSASPIVLMS